MNEPAVGMKEMLWEVAKRWPGSTGSLYIRDLRESGLEWLLSDEAKAYGPKLVAAWAMAVEDVAKMPKYWTWSRTNRRRLVERWFRQVMVNAYIRMAPIRTD